jgi:hypothetical protein
MALSTQAAEALVAGYLAGHTLPAAVHRAVVLAARARLIDGDVPVLDEMLCIVIDRGADAERAIDAFSPIPMALPGKELIMTSRFESSFGNAGSKRKTMRVCASPRVMSEKEIHAYLVSRDTVRRIQRISSLLVPLPSRGVNHLSH